MSASVKLSKFLSLVLRHRPDVIKLNLDEAGWAIITELADRAGTSGLKLTPRLIRKIVAENSKQRFSISDDGLRIRANQGHTRMVELGLKEVVPPKVLYHGTARNNLSAIRRYGIKRGKRNYVHLSADTATALKVGMRHGTPVVLTVLSEIMHKDGISFFQSENGVWLTEFVPPHYVMPH